MTELVIDVQGLSKHFGNKVAVNDVSLKLPKGQVWGFLGPNGSGKTTTIRMLCGLLKASSGEGRCLGYDLRRDAELIRRHTGYMTQKFSFWNELTVRENLEFVARIYELKHRRRCVNNTLEVLGLEHRQHQLTEALSGGWKQRLALAAVTMHEPELLLLDEPTAGVDPQARRDFWDQIHRLSNQGMTVLVSTHYMDEAERCDHIAYLAHGNLITEGTVPDIVDQSGLISFRAEGPQVRSLEPLLASREGVEYAAYFGAGLHISGHDRVLLEQAMQSVADKGYHWQEIRPSLEDVFIALMSESGADQRSHV
ncbi:putative multidrug ABC transporter ATP-binding protein YbhF [Zhongshania aliphaticivorans]|uniref:Putative multidrug ABC transporter ATP-binding protein YbhF n=1 Tax=Zhongshania aliphaticivorans TaxID=1470434 RepID=A0A5S9P635_9GAMM|nr:ABC transporter ATP-binding protein [Zhongshania aliphaticivorans]CAA0091138.1 putative multidrug ABC transporter ATP-binding protein YbhF [Zhongshania aliphaticivorans]CAA0098609.1 putative multidrug ABC transporter ATP-binding protein YbhF [Zhongshania aliphaticivorans]